MGSRLRPKFYGTRYVISNPEAYQLGSLARNQRWIRYGDDVLLVNIRSGRVAAVFPRRYRDM
jgi:Ni/Co efflux regulator RcnB